MEDRIYHITTAAGWEKAEADGKYRSDTLDSDGFIHCSHPRQLADVANSLFEGIADLVILVVETARLHCEVIDEDLYGLNETFPHVYGAIPLNAVIDVVPLPIGESGIFRLPKAIAPN